MSLKLPGICFIGCGNIAACHAKNIRKSYKKLDLFFYDKENNRSIDYKSKFNGVASFSDIKHVFDSDAVDIVFITTPHAFHEEIACAAAVKGKHIIIEKPAARNSRELKKIVSTVKKYDVRCTIAENYLYKSFVAKIINSIRDGDIGKPLFIDLKKYNHDETSGWRTDANLMGGGALLEGGVHWVNLLVSLANSDPLSVIAMKPDVEYDTNVPFEDSLSLSVKFENGIVGNMLHSWRIPNRFKGISLSKIYGTDGVITFESNGIFTSVWGKKKKKFFTNFTDFLGYNTMIKSFIDDYVNDIPWNPGLDRISKELHLVESAYKSLNSGKVEKIS